MTERLDPPAVMLRHNLHARLFLEPLETSVRIVQTENDTPR
jgi:hypothetical protein